MGCGNWPNRAGALALTIFVCPPLAHAEDENTQDNSCARVEARQFDFWIGEWDLEWDDGRTGHNVITRTLDDCVILEIFDGTPSIPLKGMSVSTYDPATGQWQQTWVDNNGGYLDFTGGFEGSRMVLKREAERDGERFLQRMVWYDIEPDSLSWNWERSDDGGETWEVLWAISYRRSASSDEAADH